MDKYTVKIKSSFFSRVALNKIFIDTIKNIKTANFTHHVYHHQFNEITSELFLVVADIPKPITIYFWLEGKDDRINCYIDYDAYIGDLTSQQLFETINYIIKDAYYKATTDKAEPESNRYDEKVNPSFIFDGSKVSKEDYCIGELTGATFIYTKSKGENMIKKIQVNEKEKIVTVVFNDSCDVKMSKWSEKDEFDPSIGVALCIAAHMFKSKRKFKKFVSEQIEKNNHKAEKKEAKKWIKSYQLETVNEEQEMTEQQRKSIRYYSSILNKYFKSYEELLKSEIEYQNKEYNEKNGKKK